jgi:phosphotransferase system  glucose/maltose/N-acetylglucosamine-specific IIC component
MELFFVALGGAVLGLAARYLLPRRTTQGWVLVPAIGTAVASVVWVALTWLGWKWDGGWIWWVALGLAAVAAFTTDIVLSRRRSRSDQRMLHSLMKTGTPHRA